MFSDLMRTILFPRQFVQTDVNVVERVKGLERIWLDTSQGRVEAWFIPAPRPNRPLVIFAHGNGEAIDHWPEALAPYRETLGFSILLPEYRGYGRSGGEPSEANIAEDFVRFYDQIVERPEVDPARVLFHGRSLGGGTLGALAKQRAPRAMILESTFTSVADMAKAFFVPSMLVADPFDTRAFLAAHALPILFFHGSRDTVVPYRHAEENLRTARGPAKLVTYDCGHNDLPPDRDHYWSEIRTFVDTHVEP